MRWVWAVVVIAASAYWVGTTHPDQVYRAYSEVRRWVFAAAPLPSLPEPKPRETVPCPAVNQAATQVGRDQYFPTGVLGCGDERSDAFLTDWYSKHLKALGEPSLWALSRSGSQARVYRFLWLRSFHRPLAIRVIINSDLTAAAYVKVANGMGGYKPGALVLNQRSAVGKHASALLLSRIIETRFWDLPSRGEPGGPDGAQWIVEGVMDGKYHVVDRWSPADGDPIHVLGMTFLADIAGLQFSREELY